MKNRKYGFGIIALMIFCISCKKFLTEKELDAVTVDYIYTSPAGLETGLVGLYNLQRTSVWANTAEGLFLYCATDLALVRTYNDKLVYGVQMTPLLFPGTPWIENYQIIDRANALISNAPQVTMDDAERNQIIAQAKYIRAQAYFDLVRLYDNILLDTTATTSSNAFSKRDFVPADPQSIYNLIDADLDFAVNQLDWKVAPGRAGKGAALMVRAKSAMWQKDWATAAADCDSIIESGTYSLVDISKVFGQDVNTAETIFAYQYDQTTGGSSNLPGGSGTALAAFFTNRYYEASPEMVEDVNLGGQTDSWTVPNDYLKSLYDTSDERLQYYYWPQTYDKSYIVNNPDSPDFGKPLPQNQYPDNYRQYHWSLKKYFDLNKPVGSTYGYKDVIVYRLAETYLLGAEAHWRMTGNTSDPTALDYIGKVRARAGLDNVTTVDQQTILDERARELAFEKHRWFTLKRMGVLVDQVNQHLMFGSNSHNVVHRTMEPYMVRLPIPQSQIDLMGTFPQNQGY